MAGFNGAAVILDPQNGEVLAFASLPEYDPNAFAAGIDRATFSALITDELRPLQDRAIQGRYSRLDLQDGGRDGGAAEECHHAGLQGVLRRRTRTSTAARSSAGRRAATASMDLRHAIEQSCNVYFYTSAT